MRYLLPIMVLLTISGCTTLKNFTDPLDKTKHSVEDKNKSSNVNNTKVKEADLFFYRQKDLLTIGQRVELHINGNELGVLGHGDSLFKKVSTGKHKITTKVGLSVGIRVTGFNGACKHSRDFPIVDAAHYFKIKFRPGIFCGKHRIIEISESEYKKLKNK